MEEYIKTLIAFSHNFADEYFACGLDYAIDTFIKAENSLTTKDYGEISAIKDRITRQVRNTPRIRGPFRPKRTLDHLRITKIDDFLEISSMTLMTDIQLQDFVDYHVMNAVERNDVKKFRDLMPYTSGSGSTFLINMSRAIARRPVNYGILTDMDIKNKDTVKDIKRYLDCEEEVLDWQPSLLLSVHNRPFLDIVREYIRA